MIQAWMQAGVPRQHRAAVEQVGRDLAVLLGTRHHEGFDRRQPSQILHVARHRFVVRGTDRATKAAGHRKAALDPFPGDEVLNMLEHSRPFVEHLDRLSLAAQRDQCPDPKFLVAATDLSAVPRARSRPDRAGLEDDDRAPAAQ